MADGGRQSPAGATQIELNCGRIMAVPFFARCGGLDLGFLGGFTYLGREYERTAFDVLAAYGSDSQAVGAHRTKIGGHIELCDSSAASMTEMPLADVLLDGFPFQEFSQCGPGRPNRSEGSFINAWWPIPRLQDEARSS